MPNFLRTTLLMSGNGWESFPCVTVCVFACECEKSLSMCKKKKKKTYDRGFDACLCPDNLNSLLSLLFFHATTMALYFPHSNQGHGAWGIKLIILSMQKC